MENNDKFKPEEEKSEPITPRVEPVPVPEQKEVFYYDAYDHGFTNGILKVPKEYFQQFIDFAAKRNLAQTELGLTLKELKSEEQLLAETRANLLEYNNTIAASDHEIELIQDKESGAVKALEETKQSRQQLEQRRDSITPEYNWFNVSFFIFIGFVFVISDFLITYDVLCFGLNLETNIAVILAAAVSSITFVIKPTIDRIFEKPSIEGKKRRQNALLLTVSILAITALGCLGFFREEYFAQKQKKDAITKQVTRTEDNIADLGDQISAAAKINNVNEIAALKQEITKAEARKVQLEEQKSEIDQKTKSHGILYYIFVLCNMLFGVAGAICLSIAFPVLDQHRLKKRLAGDIGKVAEKELLMNTELVNLKSQQKDTRDIKSRAENSIALLPDLAQIENKINVLRESARSLLKLAAENSAFAESALYEEAYERGLICEFNDKIIITPHQIGSVIRRGTNSTQPRGPRSPSPNDGLNGEKSKGEGYLHQQIRNLIEYNHQNKKHLLNGENA